MVRPEGLEPPTFVPKTNMISISPRAQIPVLRNLDQNLFHRVNDGKILTGFRFCGILCYTCNIAIVALLGQNQKPKLFELFRE